MLDLTADCSSPNSPLLPIDASAYGNLYRLRELPKAVPPHLALAHQPAHIALHENVFAHRAEL
jgi:hypothetical protein